MSAKPLTPEDLENKRFTPVRFSEGYDMDEVDNYLDNDIIPRLRDLIAENSRLTTELETAHNRIAELETAAQTSGGAVEDDSDFISAAPGTSSASYAEQPAAVEPVEEPADVETTAQHQAVAEEPAAAPAAPAAGNVDQSAAGIIALANRLHDEYVKNGEDERDRLISEANDEHKRIVGEAEEKSRTTLNALEEKKAELEKSIEGLRTFERDYRNRLRNYLENQLRDLDTSETQDKQANFGL
jgi:DivIVA domain-containing protein